MTDKVEVPEVDIQQEEFAHKAHTLYLQLMAVIEENDVAVSAAALDSVLTTVLEFIDKNTPEEFAVKVVDMYMSSISDIRNPAPTVQ